MILLYKITPNKQIITTMTFLKKLKHSFFANQLFRSDLKQTIIRTVENPAKILNFLALSAFPSSLPIARIKYSARGLSLKEEIFIKFC